MSRPAPVVALDFDGVVRRLVPISNGPHAVQDGEAEFDVDLDPEVWVESPFHAKLREPIVERVLLNVWIGEWVNSLIARGVEVVWATTWEHTANHYFAPLLRIPELPVPVSVLTGYPRFTQSPASWKLESLMWRYQGRPLCWIDDSMPEGWGGRNPVEVEAHFEFYGYEPAPALLVKTSPTVGLTRPQAVEVDEWLREVSA